jgi:hypothetical protein
MPALYVKPQAGGKRGVTGLDGASGISPTVRLIRRPVLGRNLYLIVIQEELIVGTSLAKLAAW